MTEHPGLTRLKEMHEAATAAPWTGGEAAMFPGCVGIAGPDGGLLADLNGAEEYALRDGNLIVVIRNSVPQLIEFIEKVDGFIRPDKVCRACNDAIPTPPDTSHDCWDEPEVDAALQALLSVLEGKTE